MKKRMGKGAEAMAKRPNMAKTNSQETDSESFLAAHTTFRLEMLRYEEEMFVDNNPITDRSGWRLLLGRDFPDGRIAASDISSFVDDAHELCSKVAVKGFEGFDKAHVCAMLFTKYRCTLDDCMLGFILKSKTVVKAERTTPKQKRRFFLFRFAAWLWWGFKRMHNGVLESLKIG